MSPFTPNPDLDLVLERTVPVPPDKVWAAWTTPELLMQWFTPAPWKTVACAMDFRPGGRSDTTMESPDGERFPNNGCILQVIPNRLLVFTSVMSEDFRPVAPTNGAGDLPFTARIVLEPAADGAPTTPPSSCTPTMTDANATRRWASTRDGAPRSTNSSP